MNKWDVRFLALAEHIATWSKDPILGTGAVIVMPSNPREYYTGYNGFPRRVKDTPERYNTKSVKHPLIVHAELNAIFNTHKDVTGWSIYTTRFPCIRCSTSIIQSGITQVVTNYPSSEDIWKHRDEYLLTLTIFEEVGIYLQLIRGNQEMSIDQLIVEIENSEQRIPQNYVGDSNDW